MRTCIYYLKSVNLQYNTLVCWDTRTKDSSTKCLMLQALFLFTISCKILFKNCFNLFFYYKNKEFWMPQVKKKLWKKDKLGTSDAWSMSLLSWRPSKPAYYTVDWWISSNLLKVKTSSSNSQTHLVLKTKKLFHDPWCLKT